MFTPCWKRTWLDLITIGYGNPRFHWKLRSSCGNYVKMLFLLGRIWKKRKWPGAPICSFCRQVESNDHLFFTCNTSRVIWGVLASAMGARCIPTSFWQAMAYAPDFEKFYVIIIATFCWAIWNLRNKITFKKRILRLSSEITYFTVSLIV
jgi:hypothetical protein